MLRILAALLMAVSLLAGAGCALGDKKMDAEGEMEHKDGDHDHDHDDDEKDEKKKEGGGW